MKLTKAQAKFLLNIKNVTYAYDSIDVWANEVRVAHKLKRMGLVCLTPRQGVASTYYKASLTEAGWEALKEIPGASPRPATPKVNLTHKGGIRYDLQVCDLDPEDLVALQEALSNTRLSNVATNLSNLLANLTNV